MYPRVPPRHFAAVLLAGIAGVVAPAAAFAQANWVPPPEVNAFELPARELAPRPRMSLAIGMGGTFDSVGFPDGRHAVPAFFATGGAGDGLFGVDFLAFASSATGRDRAPANPVDRLALDCFGVVRPAARVRPGDTRFHLRVLRALGAELGIGLERDGRSTSSGSRFTLHAGVRLEVPITPPGPGSELRLRVAALRNFGLYTPRLYGMTAADVTYVEDTTGEVYGALVVVF